MNQTTAFGTGLPEQPIDAEVTSFREQFEGLGLLDAVVRRGAQQILQQAIEAEVQEFLQQHQDRRAPPACPGFGCTMVRIRRKP